MFADKRQKVEKYNLVSTMKPLTYAYTVVHIQQE